MSRRDYVIGLVASVAGVDTPTATAVVERLVDEGLLSLGYGDNDVERILATFSQVFGTTKVSRQDRFAAHRLAESSNHTVKEICGLISLLGQFRDAPYAPGIASVAELEAKMPKVVNFLRKQMQQTIDNEPLDTA